MASPTCSYLLASLLFVPGPISIAAAQDPAAGQGPRVDRERMWPAPSAEDWKKPCLVTWQRSYEDALAVARDTKKPILVCVNMDGEIASEHYAGVRYRQPEIAALYEPYVCVIASVYRHNPRDYDEQGRRILCPRFGSVTCGEHISIEPGLFAQFMDAKRIAPRHIGVELDSAEMYDVYYAWDTDTIFDALRDGIANRTLETTPVARGDRPFEERVASRDVEDRAAVERAYLEGDRAARRALLEAAVAQGGAAPIDLLRLAVFGLDLELARLARRALAQSHSESAIDLIAEALRVPMDPAERDLLVDALARLGESFPRARTLSVVHRGLATRSAAIDVDGWSRALADGAGAQAIERAAIESRLEDLDDAVEADARDAEKLLALAEANLALAADPATLPKYARLLAEDARRAAREAQALGANGPRLDSIRALAAFHRGDRDGARARAEAALDALTDETSLAPGWNGMALLALFAEARAQAISEAQRAKRDWPAEWLADVHGAYSLLARHPFGTDAHVVAHHDFLKELGAAGPAAEVLDQGLQRFPDSGSLHERLRGRILAEQGIDGLEAAYEAWLAQAGAPANLEWFAGYASLVTAEFHRRTNDAQRSLAAYGRGIAHYERFVAAQPDARESADHYVAVALAGRARIAYEQRDYQRTTTELLASFSRRPEAAASLDGLHLSAVDTARQLRARLVETGREDLLGRLEQALGGLDPELLELPAYERAVPDGAPADGRGARRRRSQPER